MRYNLADGELPEDLVTEPVLKVNDKRGRRILSPESCETDWRDVRIPAICSLCVHPTFRNGIERFSICTLFKQNDIATIFIEQGLDPAVKRIIGDRFFQVLWHVAKLYIHGKQRRFWRLSSNDACVPEKQTHHKTN